MSTNFEDLIDYDTFANRPAVGVPGRLFYASDTDALYRDNGSTWDQLEPVSSGSGGYTEGARVYNNADIAISNDSGTALTFNSERYDTDTIHDTVTNTGRLTCKTAGVYIISANIEFAAHSTGTRQVFIRLNGSSYIAMTNSAPVASPLAHRFSISTIYKLEVSDYLTLEVYQSSGGNLNVVSASARSPEFAMQRIG
jgi:hypothetical protein